MRHNENVGRMESVRQHSIGSKGGIKIVWWSIDTGQRPFKNNATSHGNIQEFRNKHLIRVNKKNDLSNRFRPYNIIVMVSEAAALSSSG